MITNSLRGNFYLLLDIFVLGIPWYEEREDRHFYSQNVELPNSSKPYKWLEIIHLKELNLLKRYKNKQESAGY
jgi:hypothetical protein